MRVARWAVLGTMAFAVGAVAGFAISLLRPRAFPPPAASPKP